jgi:ketosteroid isomerase-like protein
LNSAVRQEIGKIRAVGAEGDLSRLVERYFALIADPNEPEQEVSDLLHPEVQVVEHPNRFSPNGSVRDLAAIRSSLAEGRELVTGQRFDAIEHLVVGEIVVTRARWTGTLARDIGSLSAGTELRARIAHFFTFREGRIWRQETFDCFSP